MLVWILGSDVWFGGVVPRASGDGWPSWGSGSKLCAYVSLFTVSLADNFVVRELNSSPTWDEHRTAN